MTIGILYYVNIEMSLMAQRDKSESKSTCFLKLYYTLNIQFHLLKFSLMIKN